jgi:hypothetical protein
MNTYWYQRQFDGDVNVEDISDIGDIVVADIVAEKRPHRRKIVQNH